MGERGPQTGTQAPQGLGGVGREMGCMGVKDPSISEALLWFGSSRFERRRGKMDAGVGGGRAPEAAGGLDATAVEPPSHGFVRSIGLLQGTAINMTQMVGIG